MCVTSVSEVAIIGTFVGIITGHAVSKIFQGEIYPSFPFLHLVLVLFGKVFAAYLLSTYYLHYKMYCNVWHLDLFIYLLIIK